MQRILRDAHNDVVQQLASKDLTTFKRKRLESLLNSIEQRIAEANKQIQSELREEYRESIKSDLIAERAALNGVLGLNLAATVSSSQVYSGALARPFQGKFLKEHYQDLSRSNQKIIRQQVLMGWVEGESTRQIIARLRSFGFNRNYNNLATVVRTALTHYATYTKAELFAANSDLIKAEQFLATLDGRTTFVCRSNDNKVSKVGQGPQPPLHMGCRSTLLAILKGNIKGTRASVDGQVPADLNYNDWLKTRPASEQRDILGSSRYKLFKSGATMDKFVNRQGKTLTLDEFRKRDNDLWVKAFGSSDKDAFR